MTKTILFICICIFIFSPSTTTSALNVLGPGLVCENKTEDSSSVFIHPHLLIRNPLPTHAPIIGGRFKLILKKNRKQHEGLFVSLGTGATSVIFLAIDMHTGKKVVLKKIFRDPWDISTMIEVKNEVKILLHLASLGITVPQLIEVNNNPSVYRYLMRDKKAYYFAMEYLGNIYTLKSFLKNTQLTLSDKITLLQNIAKAIDLIHKKNVIHRDISPANILIHKDTLNATLIDFGSSWKKTFFEKHILHYTIIRAIAHEGYASLELINTPHSPKVDERSDIFSFGNIVYKTLTGINPYLFMRREEENLYMIRYRSTLERKKTPSLNDINPNLLYLEPILNKAIAVDIPSRYNSCIELMNDIAKAV